MASTRIGLALVAFSTLSVARVTAQLCVQVTSASVDSSCPCEEASVSFTLEGETSVGSNTVNLALIVDGSQSIEADDFVLEKNFTKQTVAAFAEKNLFVNGGEASYVQYSSSVVTSATFNSVADFNEFVDADPQARASTRTAEGIEEGTEVLLTNPASALFMIVITDGESQDEPIIAADAARAEGIEVFAVGVGDSVDETELLGIAGDSSNLFNASDFAALDAVLERILASDGGSSIPCPSTSVTVVAEFRLPVISTPTLGGSISGETVTFTVADLEDTAKEFEVVLDACSLSPGSTVIDSATYTDDQGNDPDLSRLTSIAVGNDFCDERLTASPAPLPSQAPMMPITPTPTTSKAPTPAPMPTKTATTIAPQLPTQAPTGTPTTAPAPTRSTTPAPFKAATPAPSKAPTQAPAKVFTIAPSSARTKLPTSAPIETFTSPPSKTPTLAPTKVTTLAPTPVPTKLPTSAPVATPTRLNPTTAPAEPMTDGNLGEDFAKDASYVGCYVSDPKNKVLTFKEASRSMTADVCADLCRPEHGDYFGTSFAYACSCGDFQPSTTEEGVCDAACSGDGSVACGGTNMISLFKFD